MSLLDGYKKEEGLPRQRSLLEGYEPEPTPPEPTFADKHPFVSSIPEAGKQFGTRAVKSFPEFGKGLNDLVALVGDKTGMNGLSEFGRFNARYWDDVANNIKVDPKYQGLNGLKSKETFLPTLAGEIGGQATNLLMAAGGGAGGGMAAKAAGLGKLGTGVATTAGVAIPNVAQEGEYLDKVEAFKNINGRLPNADELKTIQNAALSEKAINTILETAADRLLFTKLFPQGTASKGIKNIAKNSVEQALTEGLTETAQEGVSVGTEKYLGLNQNDLQQNLSRIGEAGLLGGLTGGVIGGATTAVSQPYDTQFNQDNLNAVKEVAAKVLNNGKELYNSQPTAFDAMRNLSEQGAYTPSIEEIAPKTVEKMATDNGVKKSRAEAKKAATQRVIEALAPNTAAKEQAAQQETQAETQPEIQPETQQEVNQVSSEIEKIAPKTAKKVKNKNQRVENTENLQANETASTEGNTIEKIAPKTTKKIKEQKAAADISGENIRVGLDENGDLQHYDISDPANIKKVGEPIYNESTHINRELAKNQDLVKKIAAEGFDENETNDLIRKMENTEDIGINNLLHTIQAKLYKKREKTGDTTFNELEALYKQYRAAKKQKIAEQKTQENIEQVAPKTAEKIKKSKETQTLVGGVEKSENITYNDNKEGQNEQQQSDERTTSQNRQMGETAEGGEVNRGTNVDSGRGNDSGLEPERQRISPKDKEVVETEYKNQHELNQAIENYINTEEYRKYNGSVRMPQEVKDWLKKYAGAGGLEKQGAEGKGLLSEYYTPQNVVNKMWDLTKQYVKTDGAKVLEPSVGIGRFLENAPENTNFDVVEMNPVSAKITKILYPDANVTTGEFQERFIDKEKNLPVKNVDGEYDIVIGNPPYGQYSGRYKGLGEGKKFARIEAYFINRGLDVLKENGVMTFIVPSSFLDGAITVGKQEISKKCEILDAYRLPENTFDTTSIGTDIIVLRKKTNGNENRINLGRWFKEHPEKILGNIESRKNRYGKMEDVVKGDKNAVDSIDTSKTDIQETKETISKKETVKKTATPKTKATTEKTSKVQKAAIEYEEYKPENPVSEQDYQTFRDTLVDGSLPQGKYAHLFDERDDVNKFNGKYYNDFNYLQGDIYEKLDALENEDMSDAKKELQRKKLMKVLPQPKELRDINLTPTSDFIREYPVKGKVYDYATNSEVDGTTYLDKKYLDWVDKLTYAERNGVNSYDIDCFVRGEKIRMRFRGNPSKEEKENQRAEYMTKLKNAVDKTFNDFLNTELTETERKEITDKWNRKFNKLYTPDYKKMPMIVKGLNSKFYGKDLKLQDVQIEGINYLTNKGVGLLGFEVGVGKTLAGTIATVQNMQMGRCNRPLILVPKQVKPNWIREIHEAFPNIKVNDLDNLSNFKGEIEDGTISIATFQALDNVWYSNDTINKLKTDVYRTGNDFNRDSTKRGEEKTKERFEEFIGKAEGGNKKKFTFEELGIDHITVDEAHNFKNLFADAKADGQEGNTYSKITGAESTRAKRMFLATQYILGENKNRNVFMLTATPFNNSPLEVFNMLSYMAKDKLDKMGLYNVYQFMENYVDITADWVVDSKNNVVFKQIAKGFKNLESLQGVIDSCMLIRSAEDAGIKRPNKHTKKVILEPTQDQLKLISEAEAEAVGIKSDDEGNISIDDNASRNGAVLQAIHKARTATLSPDIYRNNFEVSPEDFVKNSPKINYVAQAVEAMLKKDPKTSQIIYMPLGVDFLPKLKQYFVNKKVLKADEIAIIKSGVNDDKINEITDSFNDVDGKIKLIIGTNKIKEGMNLNKNSSVLYVPYMDWNPTDYLQIVGRIWRRGNKYKDIRVVVPLLKDSSDPFMFQKLDEKTSRINNIMDRGKNYIDTGELDTAEEKINMIANPDKKASMFSQIEAQKLNSEKDKLEGQLDTTRYYIRGLKNANDDIKEYTENIQKAQEALKTLAEDSWEYRYNQNNLERYKKELNNAKLRLKQLNDRIKRFEIDLSGKDSEDSINAEIEKVNKKIEALKDTTEKKRAQYKDEYEKTRNTSKSIEELITEFNKDTENLYSGEDFDIPFISDIVESFKDYQNVLKAVKSGKKIGELVDSVELLKIFKDKLKGLEDYTIFDMAASQREMGRHIPSLKVIQLDMNKIGNDVNKFVITLFHEIEHARQFEEYKRLKAKPNKTYSDLMKIRAYDRCTRVNKNKKKYYNEHKGVLKPILDTVLEMRRQKSSAAQINEYFKTLNDEQFEILTTYKDLYDVYLNTENEVLAREAGQSALERVKSYEKIGLGQNNGEPNKRLGNRAGAIIPRNIVGRRLETDRFNGEGSDAIGLTSVQKAAETRKKNLAKAKTLDNAAEASEKAKGYVRKWYADIEKDRYDVNKSLTSFINLTKEKARQLSKDRGFKVTDKEIREIMPFLRERTELPQNLNRPELTRLFNSLTDEEKNSLTSLADNLSNKMDKYYKEYQENKGIDDYEMIENHISHIWDVDKKQKSMLTNYFTTKSRFAKERTIETLYKGIEGIEIGGETVHFKPKTLDYAEILKTETDSFIKANSDMRLAKNIKGLKQDGAPLVLPYGQAPADWVEITHPALSKGVYNKNEDITTISKMPVKVHPDIAKPVLTVFDTPAGHNAMLELADNTNAVYKQLQLGFSGFHIVALSESMLGNLGVKGTLKFLNPAKIFDEVGKGNWGIYKDDSLAKQAIDDGLQFGATLDLDRNLIENVADNTVKWIEKHIPVIGGQIANVVKPAANVFTAAQKLNSKILWDYFHNNYKLECYKMLCAQEGADHKLSDSERKEIAHWVNDSFGGQVWENLGIRPSQRRIEQRVLLSPDWLRSTTRQFLAMFSGINKNETWKNAKELGEEWGIDSLTKDVQASDMRGKIARRYWVRSLVYSAILYNALNAAFRAWDRDKNPDLYPKNMSIADYTLFKNVKDNRTHIFVGRNSDGTERYLRLGKQFREVPEIVLKPIEKLGGKASPIVQMTSQALTGSTASGFRNNDFYNGRGKNAKLKTGWDRVGATAGMVTKSMLPYSVNSLFNPYTDATFWSLIAPVGKGTTFNKGLERYDKALRSGNKKEVAETTRDLRMNKISPEEVMKAEIKNLRKEAFSAAMQKLKSKKN